MVFQALGHLWIRDLPDGKPRRLTRAQTDDHVELYPSFSRDGRSIVYTTWDDHELGSVRVVSAAGGAGRVVTREPGHYVEPVFSPDGEQVVYRKVTGGFLRTSTWSREPGIYSGGGRHLLATGEERAHHRRRLPAPLRRGQRRASTC